MPATWLAASTLLTGGPIGNVLLAFAISKPNSVAALPTYSPSWLRYVASRSSADCTAAVVDPTADTKLLHTGSHAAGEIAAGRNWFLTLAQSTSASGSGRPRLK